MVTTVKEDTLIKKSSKKSKYISFLKSILTDWQLYALLIPAVIWFILFAYKPMEGLKIAFMDYNVFKGMEGSQWVGFQNFNSFMTSDSFFRTMKNTIMISVYRILICFPAPIILAILLNEVKNKYIRKFTQTITFLPYFISIVVVCGMVVTFLAPSTGIVNIILRNLGLEEIYFMVKPEYFRGIYTGMTLWRESGFEAIVYIAALVGVDQELYEAAAVDGAGKWHQIKNITLPCILPTIVTMLVLNVGKMVKVGFESILLLYQPATYETADVLGTYVYRTGLIDQNYGLATAAGLFEGVIALVLVVLCNYISKKISETSLW